MNAQERTEIQRELKTLREQVEASNSVGALGTIDVIEGQLETFVLAATQPPPGPPPVEEGGGS